MGGRRLCTPRYHIKHTQTSLTRYGITNYYPGPYAPAILRFHISFPDTYPSLPPLVTFSTDIFHPLITPLTTYVHTTDITDSGTVSATDEERLPPGGFSLRHGFPAWFGRGSRSRQTSGQHAAAAAAGTPPRPVPPPGASQQQHIPEGKSASPPAADASPSATLFAESQSLHRHHPPGPPSTYEVFTYLSSTFGSESVLDSVPLEAAGNPGAWHAWRARQRSKGPGNPAVDAARKPEEGGGSGSGRGPTPRKPGEWNWEGVWEERVKRGVQASLSEAVLFGQGQGSHGGQGADEVINFLNLDDGDVQGVKENLLRTLGVGGTGAATAS